MSANQLVVPPAAARPSAQALATTCALDLPEDAALDIGNGQFAQVDGLDIRYWERQSVQVKATDGRATLPPAARASRASSPDDGHHSLMTVISLMTAIRSNACRFRSVIVARP